MRSPEPFDAEGYRVRMHKEIKKLKRLPPAPWDAGTVGRISGLYLALSHLEEFINGN